MEKWLIARGILAGAVGAVLAFVFARLFAERFIARAIEFEDGRIEVAHAQGVPEHGAELFTRGVQGNAGLGFGVLIFGIAMGALFAVSFCLLVRARRTSESIDPQSLSMRLAAASFITVYLVPFLKYPPNPPAVGQADTIGFRTLWYLVMVSASVVLAIAALRLARQLSVRFGAFNAPLLAAGAYAVAVVAVAWALPNVAEIPSPLRDAAGVITYPGFPADVLYEFRLAALGTQLVLWVTIGLVFALLARRLSREGPSAKVESIGA